MDKEARVASRRVRNYALRTGYILLLSILTLSAWCLIIGVQSQGATVFGVSRVSQVGTYLTARIIWFQFVAAQLIAAVMLSSSMSDEMRSGTLSVLMTTPITSWQIVLGKLLSRLLQIVLLLAISLPALAILRVLGGVPWDFVLAGFCITLSAAVFAGALSLWLSTYYRHAYKAISAGAAVYLALFVVLPAVAMIVTSAGVLNESLVSSVLDLTNPRRAFTALSRLVWPSRPAGLGYFFSWPIHCLIMAAVTAVMLCMCTWRIRRAQLGNLFVKAPTFRPTESVHGAPIAWKENRRSPFPWSKRDVAAGVIALAVCALTVLGKTIRIRGYEVHVSDISWGLWMVAFLRLAISVAGGITREKESGTWPVLLTTPLDDTQIVRGKAIAGLRRNAVLLLSACAVQMCFMLCASASPKALSVGLCTLSATGSVFFVTAAGLYFGVRLRTTTAAVGATVGAYLCLHYIVGGRFNPVFGWLLYRVVYSSGGRGAPFMLLGFGMGATTFVLDTGLGFFLVQRAHQIVRRHVF